MGGHVYQGTQLTQVSGARDSVEWRKHRLLDLYNCDERFLQIS